MGVTQPAATQKQDQRAKKDRAQLFANSGSFRFASMNIEIESW